MQKSIGFNSLLALGGAVGLLAMTAPAQAQITNGSFESPSTSNFSGTGWTLTPATSGNISAIVSSADGKTAVDGTYFAHLSAGTGSGSMNYTTLSQTFNALNGQTLSGSAYFQANGTPTNNDDAIVEIVQGTHILFTSNISAVGSNNATPWTSFSWTFTANGTYTILAEVRNVHSNGDPSSLGLDNVSLSTGTHASPATPEGSSLLMLVAGGLPFAAVPILRRRRK